jgi:Flp pilus assembly pilin Flp
MRRGDIGLYCRYLLAHSIWLFDVLFVNRREKKRENYQSAQMKRIKILKCLCKSRMLYACDQGATAVEYAIILALIAAVILTAVASVGTTVTNFFASATQGW